MNPDRKRLLARTSQKLLDEVERDWDENQGNAEIARGSVEVRLLSTDGRETSCRATFASKATPNPLPAIGEVVLVTWDNAGVAFGRLTDTGDTIWDGGWEIRDSLASPAVWRPGRKPDKWTPLPDWIPV